MQRRARRWDCHSVCFHSTCFSWLLRVGDGYRGMPSHADKNSLPGLLGSGVFSPEVLLDGCGLLLFFPFCPLLSAASVPSLPEQCLWDQSCSVTVGHDKNPALLCWGKS